MADIKWSLIQMGGALTSRSGPLVPPQVGPGALRATVMDQADRPENAFIGTARVVAGAVLSMVPGVNIAAVAANAAGVRPLSDHPVGRYFTTTGVVGETLEIGAFAAKHMGFRYAARTMASVSAKAFAMRGYVAGAAFIVSGIVFDPMTSDGTKRMADAENTFACVPSPEMLANNLEMQKFAIDHPEMDDLLTDRARGDNGALMDDLAKRSPDFLLTLRQAARNSGIGTAHP